MRNCRAWVAHEIPAVTHITVLAWLLDRHRESRENPGHRPDRGICRHHRPASPHLGDEAPGRMPPPRSACSRWRAAATRALLPLTISFGEQDLTAISAAMTGSVIAFYWLGYGIAAFGVGPHQSAGISLSAMFGLTACIAAAMGVLSIFVAHARPEPGTAATEPGSPPASKHHPAQRNRIRPEMPNWHGPH